MQSNGMQGLYARWTGEDLSLFYIYIYIYIYIYLVVSWYSLEQYIGFVVRQAFIHYCGLHQVHSSG